MNLSIRRAILISCAAALPASAWAQTGATSTGASGGLEEIVVTAQKRTERLQDVPVAVTVLSADQLAQRNVGDITDLNNLVPSVNLIGSWNGRVPLGVRGISSNASESTVGLASGVAIMVDGVSVPSDSSSANELADIQSVEVLKGPQSTLGGRAASAGIINIVTRGPTDHFTGDISATATNDDEYRFNGFLAGPLAEGIAGSLSFYDGSRKFPVMNLYNGERSGQKNDGVRGKLRFKPNENLTITLVGDYHQSNSKGDNFVYSYITPGADLLFGTSPPPLPPPVVNAVSQGHVLAGVTPSWNNQYANSVAPNIRSDNRDDNFSVIVDYALGDLTLGSTTAYQHEKTYNVQDLFVNSAFFSNDFRNAFASIIGAFPGSPGTWADFNNTQTQDLDIKQTSEELKLVSPTNRDFSYVVGLYLSDSKVTLDAVRTFTPAAATYDVTADTKTYDIYGRGTWAIAPNTKVFAGLRFNEDRLSYDYSAPGSTANSSNSDASHAIVGDLGLQFQVDRNSMLYATYSRGYAPRVFNTGIYSGGTATAPTGALPVTSQTKINSFEVGSKGTYLDNRLSLNADLFYTVYSDYQVQTSASIPGVNAPINFLVPAGKARTEGVEFETTFVPDSSTRLDLNLAYIKAEFVEYNGAPCWGNGVSQTAALGCLPVAGAPGQVAQNVSGDPMPNAPKFKGVLTGEKKYAVSDGNVDLVLGGSYAYRSSAQMQPDQNPETLQGAYGILNLTLGLREGHGRWSVTAFCNNVTDKHYAADVEDFWSGPWNSNAVVIQPARDSNRYYGIKLKAGW